MAELEQMIEWQWGEIVRLTVTLQAIDEGRALAKLNPAAIAVMREDLKRLTESLPALEAKLARGS